MRKGEIKTLPPQRGTRVLLPRYHPVWQRHHSARIGDNSLPALSATIIAAPRITDGDPGQIYLEVGGRMLEAGSQNAEHSLRELCYPTSDL